MKNLPELAVDPDVLFDLQFGITKGNIMMAAIELDLFKNLIFPKTAAEFAASMGWHQENTELFLNGLVSIGLLVKNDGQFRNSEIADSFLVPEKETWLGGYLEMYEQFLFKSRQQVKDLLQKGPPELPQNNEMDGEFFAAMTRKMLNFARSGVSRSVASELANLQEFGNFKKMIDIGGAHGLDCIAAVQSHPTMTGVVLDKPPVLEVTKTIIAEYGMEDRIKCVGGDYITDALGVDYDLVLAKGTLNFAGSALPSVVAKIYDSLREGGVFVSIHDGLIDERTRPEKIVISWLPMAMSSKDVSFEQHTIPNAMEAAGFVEIEVKPFPFSMGERLDMVIGRKK